MGQLYEQIDDKLRAFIEDQQIFFVATAPSGSGGHVNLSPKGVAGTLAILDPSTIAYLDITASGAETIAHLRQNVRITLMFCAFVGPPTVLRLQGHGRVVSLYDEDYPRLAEHFSERRGARAVIMISLTRIADSCGFGVPIMNFAEERDLLPAHMDRKGVQGLVEYRRARNRTSIDGLPAFDHDPDGATD